MPPKGHPKNLKGAGKGKSGDKPVDQPFQCADCNLGFSRKDSLVRHEKIHKKADFSTELKAQLTCSYCQSTFARLDNLHLHTKDVPQGFRCKGDPEYKKYKKSQKSKVLAKVAVWQIVGPTPGPAAPSTPAAASPSTAAALDTSSDDDDEFPPKKDYIEELSSGSSSPVLALRPTSATTTEEYLSAVEEMPQADPEARGAFLTSQQLEDVVITPQPKE